MNVYLDDCRKEPDGWVRVYWPQEAIELLKTGKVKEFSLDHDLGNDEIGTGYDVVKWIEEQVVLHGQKYLYTLLIQLADIECSKGLIA